MVNEKIDALNLEVGKLLDLCGQVVEMRGICCEDLAASHEEAVNRGNRLLYEAECLLGKASKIERRSALALLHPARSLWNMVSALTSKRIRAWMSGKGLDYERAHERRTKQDTARKLRDAVATERDPYLRQGLLEDLDWLDRS